MLILAPCLIEDKDKNQHPGGIAECETCLGRAFEIIKLEHHNHPHFVCLGCGISYCGTWDGSQCQDEERVQ